VYLELKSRVAHARGLSTMTCRMCSLSLGLLLACGSRPPEAPIRESGSRRAEEEQRDLRRLDGEAHCRELRVRAEERERSSPADQRSFLHGDLCLGSCPHGYTCVRNRDCYDAGIICWDVFAKNTKAKPVKGEPSPP